MHHSLCRKTAGLAAYGPRSSRHALDRHRIAVWQCNIQNRQVKRGVLKGCGTEQLLVGAARCGQEQGMESRAVRSKSMHVWVQFDAWVAENENQ